MKKSKPLNRKRPGVLVRFYPTDLARLNEVCAAACTPRENYIRRAVLAKANADLAVLRTAWSPSPPTVNAGPLRSRTRDDIATIPIDSPTARTPPRRRTRIDKPKKTR